jgi:hypothetical protein
MSCEPCKTIATYNMNCLQCAARHVVNTWRSWDQCKQYMESLATRYKHDLDKLQAEVKKQITEKRVRKNDNK